MSDMEDTERTRYRKWLNRCASEAMRSEWCIDTGNDDFWYPLFKGGKSPKQAVTRMFEEIVPQFKPPN